MARILLILPTATYRAPDFMAAARRLGVDVVVASEHRQAMSGEIGDRALVLPLSQPDLAVDAIAALHERTPLEYLDAEIRHLPKARSGDEVTYGTVGEEAMTRLRGIGTLVPAPDGLSYAVWAKLAPAFAPQRWLQWSHASWNYTRPPSPRNHV